MTTLRYPPFTCSLPIHHASRRAARRSHGLWSLLLVPCLLLAACAKETDGSNNDDDEDDDDSMSSDEGDSDEELTESETGDDSNADSTEEQDSTQDGSETGDDSDDPTGDDSSEETDDDSGEDSDTDVDPSLCENLPDLPLKVEIKTGFLTSEDFVFDDMGSVVGIDESGNVVRRGTDGSTKLIAADVSQESSGTRYMPNGDLILATGTDGRILKISPDGVVETLATGLAYPNGIDIDSEGLIYIGEQSASRLITLDPKTGEITELARDIYRANGVTLTADESKIYVGSFGGGVVYEVENSRKRSKGALASFENESRAGAKIFAYTPGSPGIPQPIFSCDDLEVGATCFDSQGAPGLCEDDGGARSCAVITPCTGRKSGDDCATPWGAQGVCEDSAGTLSCTYVPPLGPEQRTLPRPIGAPLVLAEVTCDGVEAGSACATGWNHGICVTEDSKLVCVHAGSFLIDACEGKVKDDACEAGSTKFKLSGKCGEVDEDNPAIHCDVSNPVSACEGKESEDTCLIYGGGSSVLEGQCKDEGGSLSCISPAEGEAGGLDGIDVDACGNVYVTEYIVGKVWRILADGSKVEEAAKLPSEWIPNMRWGTGIGGWDENTLYVSDRDEGRIFGLEVGLPGVPEVFP